MNANGKLNVIRKLHNDYSH